METDYLRHIVSVYESNKNRGEIEEILFISKILYYNKSYKNNFSKTITAHMKNDCNMYIHPTQARGLTPREAARIQSFPDDYILAGTKKDKIMQIGNAVACRFAYHLGLYISDKDFGVHVKNL